MLFEDPSAKRHAGDRGGVVERVIALTRWVSNELSADVMRRLCFQGR